MNLFKLSPQNLEKWSVTREKGKRRFYLFWTLYLGVFMSIFMSILNHYEEITSQFPFLDTVLLVKLGGGFIIYLAAGYFTASILWYWTEKSYKKQISDT